MNKNKAKRLIAIERIEKIERDLAILKKEVFQDEGAETFEPKKKKGKKLSYKKLAETYAPSNLFWEVVSGRNKKGKKITKWMNERMDGACFLKDTEAEAIRHANNAKAMGTVYRRVAVKVKYRIEL